MNYFLDTEFKESQNSLQLISIGIVSEDDRRLYAISKDFDVQDAYSDTWIRDNVLHPILKEHKTEEDGRFNYKSFTELVHRVGKTNEEIAQEVEWFVEDSKPVFYGYYPAYDWVLFCWLFGRMIDLPKGFPKRCNCLRQMMNDAGISMWDEGFPKQENEHNALDDARWNKELYSFITRK